ncbi:hypothetical protein [Corynebacterium aurimucosum]|uniref:hypothetical protein n=1 Tax=Corynebacterium aurimucosum TaxID=169292 RepID=UPI00187A14C8|nr:hypothetical protein [Corynebacterium aurimucosum]MBE7338133.1 hypothetical protein [Corynebacterium aurimucosum]
MTTPIDVPMPYSVVWKATGATSFGVNFDTAQAYYKLAAGYAYVAQVSNNASSTIGFHRSSQQSHSTRVKVADVLPGKTALVPSLPVPVGDVMYISPTAAGGLVVGETVEVRLMPVPITTT